MKVSIITLTYNSEKNILQCLESINNQNYKEIEHIVIDGLSTDRTLEIIHRNKIGNSIIISESDRGIYDAWNKGFKAATGDIIGTVMSDDYLTNNNVISDIVHSFRENDCDILYGNMNFQLKNVIVREWKPGDFKKSFFYFGWMPPPPTVYVSKNVLNNNSFFNIKYKIAGDYEWLLRIFFIQNYRIFYLNKFMYTLRMGGISNKSLFNIIKSNVECFHAWKDNKISKFPFWVFLKPLLRVFQIKKPSEIIKFYFRK